MTLRKTKLHVNITFELDFGSLKIYFETVKSGKYRFLTRSITNKPTLAVNNCCFSLPNPKYFIQ